MDLEETEARNDCAGGTTSNLTDLPTTATESESVTLRLTVYHQSVRLGDKPLRLTTSNFVCQLKTCGYSPHVISSLMRGLVCRLQLLSGSRQLSHSQVRVPRESWTYFTVSDPRLHQPGGPGPCIYISQE
jgi:hypothetical protein